MRSCINSEICLCHISYCSEFDLRQLRLVVVQLYRKMAQRSDWKMPSVQRQSESQGRSGAFCSSSKGMWRMLIYTTFFHSFCFNARLRAWMIDTFLFHSLLGLHLFNSWVVFLSACFGASDLVSPLPETSLASSGSSDQSRITVFFEWLYLCAISNWILFSDILKTNFDLQAFNELWSIGQMPSCQPKFSLCSNLHSNYIAFPFERHSPLADRRLYYINHVSHFGGLWPHRSTDWKYLSSAVNVQYSSFRKCKKFAVFCDRECFRFRWRWLFIFCCTWVFHKSLFIKFT